MGRPTYYSAEARGQPLYPCLYLDCTRECHPYVRVGTWVRVYVWIMCTREMV